MSFKLLLMGQLEHIIKITLINYRFGTKTIKLHCFPGLASNFVELISTNVNNNK